jgi:integrase
VTISGRDYYLGPFGSPSSKEKYAALIRAWQNQQECPELDERCKLEANTTPTVNDLILAYLNHVQGYYKPNHGRNSEAGCVDDALKVVQECGYGREPANAFRPKDLKRIREAMVKKDWSRGYINHQIARVRRMFSFAVEEDLVAGSVYHGLLAVKGLRKGTPGVREAKKVRIVPISDIKPVLAEAHGILRAMLLFAYRTGARPGEVCALKPCHLDRSERIWIYMFHQKRTRRSITIRNARSSFGPRAQKTLKPWLEGIGSSAYVFSPIVLAQSSSGILQPGFV